MWIRAGRTQNCEFPWRGTRSTTGAMASATSFQEVQMTPNSDHAKETFVTVLQRTLVTTGGDGSTELNTYLDIRDTCCVRENLDR